MNWNELTDLSSYHVQKILGGWVHEKRLPEMQRNLLEQALMMYRLRYICVSFRSVYYMRLTGYGFADLSY